MFPVGTTAWQGSVHCPRIEYESKAKIEWVLDLLVKKSCLLETSLGQLEPKTLTRERRL